MGPYVDMGAGMQHSSLQLSLLKMDQTELSMVGEEGQAQGLETLGAGAKHDSSLTAGFGEGVTHTQTHTHPKCTRACCLSIGSVHLFISGLLLGDQRARCRPNPDPQVM